MSAFFRNAVIVLFLLSEVGDIVKTKLVKLLFLADYKGSKRAEKRSVTLNTCAISMGRIPVI